MSAVQPRSMRIAAVRQDGRFLRLPHWAPVALGLAVLCAIACEDNVEPIALSFELVGRDANATQSTPQPARTPSYRVIQDAGSWDSFSLPGLEAKSAAAIDFASEMVLAVFMGEKPTGGYGIAITAVELRGRTVTVSVEETQPPANAMLMQVITNPYAIYRIALPEGLASGDGIATIEFQRMHNDKLEPLSLQRLP